MRTRTSDTFSHHPRTLDVSNFELVCPFHHMTIPENFLMIPLTVQELPCWQTHKQTLRKIIQSWLRGWSQYLQFVHNKTQQAAEYSTRTRKRRLLTRQAWCS